MKNVKYLFVILCLFCFNSVYAEECDTNDIAQLKKLAKNVDINYEYMGMGPDKYGIDVEKYHITILNLVNSLAVGIVDGRDSEMMFKSTDAVDNKIEFDTTFSQLKITIYDLNCNTSLEKMTIALPRYNYYSEYPECKSLEKYHLNVCDEWYQGKLDDDLFFQTIDKYIEDDKDSFNSVVNFIKNNIILFGIGVGVILFLIAFLLIRRYRRRSVIE